jgi:hypothetical protein
MWRLIFLSLVGCGIVTVRAQPHEEVQATGFSRAVADCTDVPILFDVAFERARYLSSTRLDLKTACVAKDAKFSLRHTVTELGLPPESDCGGGGIPRGAITLEHIAMQYEYTADGVPKTDVAKFECGEGARTLYFEGPPENLNEVLTNCFVKVENGAEQVRKAMNLKASRLRFYGVGSCSPDFCGSISMDVSFAMTEAAVNMGDAEVCK